MWRKRQLAIGIFFVLLAVITTAAAGPTTISEFVTAAKQDSPLQIVGFRMPDAYGDGPAILVHNTTAKQITWFDFTILYGDPRKVGGADPKMHGVMTGQRGDTLDNVPTPVAPNGDAEFKFVFNYLSPSTLALFATPMGSACMHVAVIVETVRFADGTNWRANATNSWSANMANDEPMWKDSIRPESGSSCDSSPDAKETLKGLKQVVIGTDPGTSPTKFGSDPVQFYSSTCALRDDKGQLTAVCGW